MKFDVITKQTSMIKSEHFRIRYDSDGNIGIVRFSSLFRKDDEYDDIEFPKQNLDELIQGLLLFKKNNESEMQKEIVKDE